MKECPDCNAVFGSDGSYRVHKHRYHRATQQAAPQQAVMPIEEPKQNEYVKPPQGITGQRDQKEEPEKQKDEYGGGGLGDLAGWAALGAVAIAILFAIFGKKQ